MPDDYDLSRFVRAQDQGGTYAQALAELHLGRKVSHWMWFVFPQLAGLGRSAMAKRYAITSPAEARAYLDHEVLGPRLEEASTAVAEHSSRRAEEIFGAVDALKLRSSMTLFSAVAPEAATFATVLRAFFDGQADPATRELLGEGR
jgi:uncharacterized protein (DUF1810 family)